MSTRSLPRPPIPIPSSKPRLYVQFSTPLLEHAISRDTYWVQDQTVKVAETREFEAQIARLIEENAELRKRVNEVSSLEAAKKKAEGRIETLEAKVCGVGRCSWTLLTSS